MMMLLLVLLAATHHSLPAQVIEVQPVFPKVTDDVTITFHAEAGNGALLGVSPVYAHAGLITSQSQSGTDWQYVQGVWGTPDPKVLMQSLGNNRHSISYNIQEFYGVPAGETVESLAFVFRNANGSIVGRAADGADIYYPVYPEEVEFQSILLTPQQQSLILMNGESVMVRGATSQTAELTLLDNGEVLYTTTGTLLEYDLIATQPGFHEVIFRAVRDIDTLEHSFTYTVVSPVITLDPPAGREDGFTWLDATTAHVQLYAPGKSFVHLIGDMNDWTVQPAYQLYRSEDGTTWWTQLEDLEPDASLRYQYLVDGALRIADPYSTLVLDPFHDAFISPETYPDMPAYPHGLTSGIVSHVTPEPLRITAPLSPKPAKSDLIIYELLLRDFLADHAFASLTDTLDYLQRLGINAVQLMPVQEFEGNLSWGYNPSYHMALDKYYGSADALHDLVEACHDRGMAVILDVVYNHAFGQSPLVQLYWNAVQNRPADDSPWFNPVARHDFNVGYDFNHELPATRAFVKRVMGWWLETFGVDGFRFDLSKGFTQQNTLGDIAAWNRYDTSRINILQDYADHMWSIDPEAYVILEHFADNDEEVELASRGMMLWGNMHFAYGQASMGYGGSDIGRTYHVNRGWTDPHLIGYMESHDEERIMYMNLTNGNRAGDYDIRELNTALGRIELVAPFLYLIPGPKMLWQFGELGYDYSINTCPDGTVNNNCRLDNKPIRWDYRQIFRRQRIYDVSRAVIKLRSQTAFREGTVDMSVANQFEKRIRYQHPEMDIILHGNFHIGMRSVTPGFTRTGWWYDYLSGDSLQVNDVNMTLTYAPGEYHVYTTTRLTPGFDITSSVPVLSAEAIGLRVQPTLTTGAFEVALDKTAAQDIRIAVYTLSGQPVSAEIQESAAGMYRVRVQENYPPGMLLVTVRTSRGMAAVPIVKM